MRTKPRPLIHQVALLTMAALGITVTTACGSRQSTADQQRALVSGARAKPFAPSTFAKPLQAQHRPLGERCDDFGNEACASGLCLHVSVRTGGFACTQTCVSDADCGAAGWSCKSYYVGSAQTVCMPDPSAVANLLRR